MVHLLILGDSQVERVWNHVRGDREQLKTGFFVPVKNKKAMLNGFKSIKPTVIFFDLIRPVSGCFSIGYTVVDLLLLLNC